MSDPGNASQVRMIASQVAAAAVEEYAHRYPPAPPKAEIPPPIKWAAAVIGALMTAGSVALFIWVVSTLNELQLTVARIDERQQQDTTIQRLDKIEERLSRLEQRKAEE
ncbi:hypothetical protein [Sphingomonas koreensis]